MRPQEAMAARSGGQVVSLDSIVRAPAEDGGSKVGSNQPKSGAGPDRKVSLG